MKKPPQINTIAAIVVVSISLALLAIAFTKPWSAGTGNEKPAKSLTQDSNPTSAEPTVVLDAKQLSSIKIAPVGTHLFPLEKEAVGSIDFDNNHTVQVFSPYQGKVIETFAELGDDVRKGQALYSIDSPDLIQAESALISAAATFELTSKELARAKDLNATSGGVSQREYEQAASDQQTAEGSLKAARDAVRVFGKSDAEIDQIVATRRIDPALIVCSPMAGQITARNAQPGFLAQPGSIPAPYSVSDVSRKWMLANVSESDCPLLHEGQRVEVKVMAYPDRVFEGSISRIYAAVDPTTHRATVRSEITDLRNELRPGMLADFVIELQAPVEGTAVPVAAVVRESDGSMTAWVTTDRRRFSQRIVTLGLQRDGWYQVTDGLKRGELVVADGAVFLSNMLDAPPSE